MHSTRSRVRMISSLITFHFLSIRTNSHRPSRQFRYFEALAVWACLKHFRHKPQYPSCQDHLLVLSWFVVSRLSVIAFTLTSIHFQLLLQFGLGEMIFSEPVQTSFTHPLHHALFPAVVTLPPPLLGSIQSAHYSSTPKGRISPRKLRL